MLFYRVHTPALEKPQRSTYASGGTFWGQQVPETVSCQSAELCLLSLFAVFNLYTITCCLSVVAPWRGNSYDHPLRNDCPGVPDFAERKKSYPRGNAYV